MGVHSSWTLLPATLPLHDVFYTRSYSYICFSFCGAIGNSDSLLEPSRVETSTHLHISPFIELNSTANIYHVAGSKWKVGMPPRILVTMAGLMCKFSGLEFIMKACINKYMEEVNIQIFI